jgi:hypothetical protein
MTPDTLEKLLSGYKNWRDVGNDALIGGLIAEVAVIALISEHWKRKWACELLAGIIVLIGVLIEIKYSGYADEIERQIREQSGKQIAWLNKEAGDARRDAAKANERAANAERDAAAASLALEKYKAPRTLTPEQRRRIKDKLTKFGPTPFVLAVDPTPEAITFMGIVNSVLVKALASAFEAERFIVKTGIISDTISNNPDAVYVVIGSK